MFADDKLIFIEDDNKAVETLKKVIFLFESAIGLSINRAKSSLTPINITKERTKEIEDLWVANQTQRLFGTIWKEKSKRNSTIGSTHKLQK